MVGATGTFDPFASDDDFLLGAFILEDTEVTAYHGAAPFIRSTSVLNSAAGILGTEAYHASFIRSMLVARGQANSFLTDAANKISAPARHRRRRRT